MVGIFDILVAVYALIGVEVIDMLEDKFCLGVNFSIFCCKILGGTLVARKEQLWILGSCSEGFIVNFLPGS